MPLSFQEVQPIPGLRSRAEGGKEVVGNRDGDRGGSRRSWRAGAVLRLLQPGLHVSARSHLQISLASAAESDINSDLPHKRECHLCLKDCPLFIVCFDYCTSITSHIHYVIAVFYMHDMIDELMLVLVVFLIVVQCFFLSRNTLNGIELINKTQQQYANTYRLNMII